MWIRLHLATLVAALSLVLSSEAVAQVRPRNGVDSHRQQQLQRQFEWQRRQNWQRDQERLREDGWRRQQEQLQRHELQRQEDLRRRQQWQPRP